MRWASGLLAAVVAGIAATPAPAADFCTGLRAVVAAAPSGFVSIRGTRKQANGPQQFIWTRPTVVIQGAHPLYVAEPGPPCMVWDWRETGGPISHVYDCTFQPPGPDDAAGFIAFRNTVADCLGVERGGWAWKGEGDGVEAQASGPLALDGPGWRIDSSLIYPPDGGPGLISLTIKRRPT